MHRFVRGTMIISVARTDAVVFLWFLHIAAREVPYHHTWWKHEHDPRIVTPCLQWSGSPPRCRISAGLNVLQKLAARAALMIPSALHSHTPLQPRHALSPSSAKVGAQSRMYLFRSHSPADKSGGRPVDAKGPADRVYCVGGQRLCAPGPPSS
jgi:hypothetical protein